MEFRSPSHHLKKKKFGKLEVFHLVLLGSYPLRAVFCFCTFRKKHPNGVVCHFRVVIEERKTEAVKSDSRENGVGTPPEGVPECSDSIPETLRKGGSESVANERSVTNHLDVNGHLQEKDMEKALEDQAQLIGKYEEMEKAQREWEEKFRENNNSTPVGFLRICICYTIYMHL